MYFFPPFEFFFIFFDHSKIGEISCSVTAILNTALFLHYFGPLFLSFLHSCDHYVCPTATGVMWNYVTLLFQFVTCHYFSALFFPHFPLIPCPFLHFISLFSSLPAAVQIALPSFL